ncbi:MAG: hypothetical protein DRI69_04625 [Bacteroidetes bacterium]|nr:MAG: hypothetical protein DRI69_04625 [Bacteroidota bacterium]
MNNKRTHDQLLSALAIASWLLAYLLTGRLAWHWISPESFGAVVAYITAWLILGYVVQTVLFLSVSLIARGLGSSTK